jgi:thioredoxin-related protein
MSTAMRNMLLAIFLLLGTLSAGQAAELIMFRQAMCEWCDLWDEEVGVVYEKTYEGKLAPVRQVNIHDERPRDLKDIKPVIYTPTFVLVEQGTEIGRILGYPGEDFFWGWLGEILRKRSAGK